MPDTKNQEVVKNRGPRPGGPGSISLPQTMSRRPNQSSLRALLLHRCRAQSPSGAWLGRFPRILDTSSSTTQAMTRRHAQPAMPCLSIHELPNPLIGVWWMHKSSVGLNGLDWHFAVFMLEPVERLPRLPTFLPPTTVVRGDRAAPAAVAGGAVPRPAARASNASPPYRSRRTY